MVVSYPIYHRFLSDTVLSCTIYALSTFSYILTFSEVIGFVPEIIYLKMTLILELKIELVFYTFGLFKIFDLFICNQDGASGMGPVTDINHWPHATGPIFPKTPKPLELDLIVR